jgi:hypothetical protein
MVQEFSEPKQNLVGFFLELRVGGGLVFRDSQGSVTIDSEWLVNPPRMLIYRRNLDRSNMSRAEDVLKKVARALRFKGIQAEVDDLM